MPPRSALTSSFSVSDAGNEVVCPLTNQDGSTCRKRCFGEKRYRSMQEHIRRAHPGYYIPKLPATEESFNLMVNSIVSNKPQTESRPHGVPSMQAPTSPYDSKSYFSPEHSSAHTSPILHQTIRRPSMLPAAAALAQLHNSRPEEWHTDQDTFPVMDNDNYLQNYFASPSVPEMFPGLTPDDASSQLPRDVAPTSLQRTPSGRAASLHPPFLKSRGHRPRKSSVTENARRPKHERDRSKDLKRMSLGHDRKTLSAEPSALGNKWEDLLDAAASASEADSRDLTPIPQSPRSSATPFPAPQNPSLQSYAASPLQNSMIPHSPDAHPSSFAAPHLDPFPSVEEPTYEPQQRDTTSTGIVAPFAPHHLHHSSNESATSNPFSTFPRIHHQQRSSGSSFHIPSSNLSSSPHNNLSLTNNNTSHSTNHHGLYPVQYSPIQQQQHYSPPIPQQHYSPTMTQHQQPTTPAASPPLSSPLVQHYCAACHRVAPLTSSYACTECICGICRDCVDVLVGMGPERGASCPRCHAIGGRFKPFMLDLR